MNIIQLFFTGKANRFLKFLSESTLSVQKNRGLSYFLNMKFGEQIVFIADTAFLKNFRNMIFHCPQRDVQPSGNFLMN